MRFYFFELCGKDSEIDAEDLEDLKWCAIYDRECDCEKLAIEKFANWLDERNESKTPDDTYHCAVVNEARNIKYFTVTAKHIRSVLWEIDNV